MPSAARVRARFLVVGNDGGVYQRPLNGHVNANGNATDWTDLNDGTMDALQYYAVGIGKIKGLHTTADGDQVDETTTTDTPTVSGLPAEGAPSGVLVSGGLQDNGGSLLRPGADTMVSNFGGDGGDVLVDPNDGCNIVQEYVDLAMSVTQTCAHPNLLNPKHVGAFLDATQGDVVQHRAARHQRALHCAVRRQRSEHQRVAGRRQQPVDPGEGLRDPQAVGMDEGVHARHAEPALHALWR